MHSACSLAGVALVRRVASNVKVVRGPGDKVLRTVFKGKSTVDCWGSLRGGRAVAVEVKSCTSGRLSLDILPPHQRNELDHLDRLGGLALLLVVGRSDCWAIPWPAVREHIRAGKATLGPSELGPHLCDPRRPYLERWAREVAS